MDNSTIRIEVLQDELQQTKADRDYFMKELNSHKSQLFSQKEQLMIAKSQRDENKRVLDEQISENSRLTRELNAIRREKDNVERNLSLEKTNGLRIQQRVSLAEAEGKSAKMELAKAQDRINSLQLDYSIEIQGLHHQIAELREMTVRQQNMEQEYSRSTKESVLCVQQARQEIEKLKENEKRLGIELAKHQSKCERLEKMNEDLTALNKKYCEAPVVVECSEEFLARYNAVRNNLAIREREVADSNLQISALVTDLEEAMIRNEKLQAEMEVLKEEKRLQHDTSLSSADSTDEGYTYRSVLKVQTFLEYVQENMQKRTVEFVNNPDRFADELSEKYATIFTGRALNSFKDKQKKLLSLLPQVALTIEAIMHQMQDSSRHVQEDTLRKLSKMLKILNRFYEMDTTSSDVAGIEIIKDSVQEIFHGLPGES